MPLGRGAYGVYVSIGVEVGESRNPPVARPGALPSPSYSFLFSLKTTVIPELIEKLRKEEDSLSKAGIAYTPQYTTLETEGLVKRYAVASSPEILPSP